MFDWSDDVIWDCVWGLFGSVRDGVCWVVLGNVSGGRLVVSHWDGCAGMGVGGGDRVGRRRRRRWWRRRRRTGDEGGLLEDVLMVVAVVGGVLGIFSVANGVFRWFGG